MKKVFVVLLLMTGSYTSIAQDENNFDGEPKKGFKKENIFIGGDITLAFSNVYTAVGGSPYFGYSLNKYVDVAVSTNFIYTSQRDYYVYGDKVKLIQYGPGAFVRVYPLKFLYGQVQYEHNFINFKYIPANNYSGYLATSDNSDANSILVGGGFSGGRQGKGSSFYYISVMWDVGGAKLSPYVDGLGRAIPIFRAGYNIALFQGKRYDY